MLHLAFLFLASSAVAVAVASPAPVPPLTSTPSYARNNARWARWESTPSDNDDDMEFYWAWPFMVFLIVAVVMIMYASIHQERRDRSLRTMPIDHEGSSLLPPQGGSAYVDPDTHAQ